MIADRGFLWHKKRCDANHISYGKGEDPDLLLRLYPNNEIQAKLKRPKAIRPNDPKTPRNIVVNACIGALLIPIQLPLDFDSVLSQTGVKRRGSDGMSKIGQVRCQRYGGMFREENKHLQVFLTGTLPGGTQESFDAMSQHSGYLVKMFQTYLARYASAPAKELKYLWCWEYQKRGALHIHAIVEAQTPEIAGRVMLGFPALWAKLLRLVDSKVSCDLFERKDGGTWRHSPEIWQTKAVPVEKNAANYLSKYVSKKKHAMNQFFPSRWWGTSSRVRSEFALWLKENTILLPLKIKASSKIREVRELLVKSLGECVGSFATDNSPHYSVSQAYAFSFAPAKSNVYDIMGKLVDKVTSVLEKNFIMTREKSDKLVRASKHALVVLVRDDIPCWARKEIIQLTFWGEGMGSFYDWAETELGWADFVAALKYVCTKDGPITPRSPTWMGMCSNMLTNITFLEMNSQYSVETDV